MARVLMIDDDQAIREALTTLLELDAYDVRASLDLAGGLQFLAGEWTLPTGRQSRLLPGMLLIATSRWRGYVVA